MEPLSGAPSLVDYLDAPVVVADPMGRIVYLNPVFEQCFAIPRRRAEGRALAEFFDGGDREAVLSAVAATCSRGRSMRFRIRHGELGFQVLASPIVVDGERVGAVLLLTEELVEVETLYRTQRDLHRALDRLEECAEALADPRADMDAAERVSWATGAASALADLRRATRGLDEMAEGRERERAAVLDPGRVARDAVAGVAYEMAEAGVSLDVLTAPELPAVRGDAKALQEALEALLRARLAEVPSWLALAVRSGDEGGVVVTLTDPGAAASGPPAPPAVEEIVASLGGCVRTAPSDEGERVTTLSLPGA